MRSRPATVAGAHRQILHVGGWRAREGSRESLLALGTVSTVGARSVQNMCLLQSPRPGAASPFQS